MVADTDSPTLYPGACDNVLGVGVVDAVSSRSDGNGLEHLWPGPTRAQQLWTGLRINAASRTWWLRAIAWWPWLVSPINMKCPATGPSYAAPVVAGVAGLLVQAGQQDPNTEAILASSSGNCLVKSLLMNSATKLPYWHKGALTADDDADVPLDYAQGAGNGQCRTCL